MLRAVPRTTFIAASIELAFRSGILISAIFCSCSCVTAPSGLPLGEAALSLCQRPRAEVPRSAAP
jgi:hypothetical protein